MNDQQREPWDRYVGARERTLASGRPHAIGELILGFQWVCDLEGVEAPNEAAIRAAVEAHKTPRARKAP